MKLIAFLLLFATTTLFANEAVLIDFSKLAANNDGQHRETTLDFGGDGVPEPMRRAMMTSLAIENWSVQLNTSARFISNMENSMVRQAPSRQHGTVLGARIHFPTWANNAYATIIPPFTVPILNPAFENGHGIVMNVGLLKEVSINVYGLNFPHTLFILMEDGAGREIRIPMGPLNFEGWRTLTWENPSYIHDVRNRELRLDPIYPQASSFVRFTGLLLQRNAMHIGGDFIVYFKDVNIIYDKAVLDTESDIDNEAIWEIIQTRENERRGTEVERFRERQMLYFLEQQRMAQ